MKKEITIKIILENERLDEWENGKISLIDLISNVLKIRQEDVDVFGARKIK